MTRFSTLIVRTFKKQISVRYHHYFATILWVVFMYAQPKFLERWRSLPSLNCGNQLDQHPWRQFSSSWTMECTQHQRYSPCCLAHNPRHQSVRKKKIAYMCPPSKKQTGTLRLMVMQMLSSWHVEKGIQILPWMELAFTSWAQSSSTPSLISSKLWPLWSLK